AGGAGRNPAWWQDEQFISGLLEHGLRRVVSAVWQLGIVELVFIGARLSSFDFDRSRVEPEIRELPLHAVAIAVIPPRTVHIGIAARFVVTGSVAEAPRVLADV